MTNKIKALIKASENQWEFKKLIWKEIENFSGSENMKKAYKKELLKEIAADVDYQKLPREKKVKNKDKQQEEKKETWEITKEQLLNKPNMTPKDKEWMQKALDYLVEKKMDTSENLKKLDDIIYTQESIEIWGVKRARKNISAESKSGSILQYKGITHFQRSKEMIEEQNALLAKQWMEIPLDIAYEKSMRALPGNYSRV